MLNSYNLFAVSNHYGTMNRGHYTAFCKNAKSRAYVINHKIFQWEFLVAINCFFLLIFRWYKYDDNYVTQISSNDVNSSAGYILFYSQLWKIALNLFLFKTNAKLNIFFYIDYYFLLLWAVSKICWIAVIYNEKGLCLNVFFKYYYFYSKNKGTLSKRKMWMVFGSLFLVIFLHRLAVWSEEEIQFLFIDYIYGIKLVDRVNRFLFGCCCVHLSGLTSRQCRLQL